ncbi:MAG: toxin-antitoxin system YwqK family antitoxin [Flavobacteriales bacterium]|nr:toxin-antitoxin system YwqK family antitoxin [Flavobacteriales bacterium]
MMCISTMVGQASEATNALDAEGRKTGYWIITGSVRPTKGYAPEQVIEEGNYEANKKTGLWKRYYPNGKLLSEITYANNIPNGPYKTYYETGIPEEVGNWRFNKNTGDFKRYHPNGNLSQKFTFSENGIRNGQQLYYHENGQVELEVQINNGKEEGTLKRYYANGDLKETKEFNGGKMTEGSIKTYTMKKPEVVVKETPAVPVKRTQVVKNDTPNISVFKQTGNNTLYNKDRQISQSGYFKNGRLWNGKWYRYDRNGLLETIEVYKDGKLIGHAPIDEDMK